MKGTHYKICPVIDEEGIGYIVRVYDEGWFGVKETGMVSQYKVVEDIDSIGFIQHHKFKNFKEAKDLVVKELGTAAIQLKWTGR